MEPNPSCFLESCFRRPAERTPVWLMRQAGRYLPEYRATREQAGDFLSLCRNPELAAEVTMQPLRRFDLDAAILFSDILVVPEAMGIGLRFMEGEGPILNPRIRSAKDIEKLKEIDPEKDLGYVMAVIREIQKKLMGKVPLIGFSGSPWTLACYMVEGGSSRDFSKIKTLLFDDAKLMRKLLNRIADAVADYLNAQIRNGVQAVQIFDTWGGILTPKAFQKHSLSAMVRVIEKLDATGPDGKPVPVILFAKGCGHSLEEMAQSGAHVLGLDWTTDIGLARERVGNMVALQGNMDPAMLRAGRKKIIKEVEMIMERYGPHHGHIFNLGHGITPDINPDKVKFMVDAVHDKSRRCHEAWGEGGPT